MNKIALSVESVSGTKVFGSVVVGVSENVYLDLKRQFPDNPITAAQRPEVNEAIKDSITEHEKAKIADLLDIRSGTNFTFQFKTIARYVDESKEPPTFEGENGKKFWVYRR
jgi:hypothetical protein